MKMEDLSFNQERPASQNLTCSHQNESIIQNSISIFIILKEIAMFAQNLLIDGAECTFWWQEHAAAR
jgi:hypothetical protein